MRQVWRFAMGMSGLMLITVLNTQTDKVVLSQSLTLSAFGYYSLAWVVAGYLTMLCEPVMLAFLPHMAQLVSLNDKTGLATAYRRAAQVMSVAVFPVTIFIALFAKEILGLWINDPLVTQNAGPLVSILICGSALEAVASVPLALQWAYGWTAPALWVRIGTLLLQIPAVYILSQRFGTTGGAVVWPVANAVILVAVSALIYRRLLLGKLRLWLGRDLLPPFAAALAVAGIWRALDVPQDSVTLVLFLAMAALSIFVAAALAVPVGMQTMIAALQRCIRLGQLALNRQHQSG
jgi:O-antigen/teichoic acid export membrane protein